MTQQTLAEEKKNTQEQEETYEVRDIPGGVIKALQAHTAPERGRYALNHVHVEGPEMVAADGASLAVVTLPGELGKETLYRIPKPKFGKNKPVTLTRQNGQIRAEQSDGSSAKLEVYKEAPENMHFPNYRQVIPSDKQGTVFMVNIKRLQNALELLSCAGHDTARITAKQGDCPFRVDGYGEGIGGMKTTVVISPMIDEK